MSNGIYKGLKAVSEDSFPRKCSCCGKSYSSVMDFVSRTDPVTNSNGFKQTSGDDEGSTVELFRNCACGSTLLESFHNRRDMSACGDKKRWAFTQLLDMLDAAGADIAAAREELRKIAHGEDAKIYIDIEANVDELLKRINRH